MKLTLLLIRPRRRRPLKPVAMITDWTTRDWADLPVHHPRHD